MSDSSLDAAPAADHTSLRLETFLPYRLNVCSALVTQALSRIYAERYRMSVPEWRVLVTLGEVGPMTAKAIGLHSHMHKTKVSRAVAMLERRRLVARKANRADRREAFLSLTPAGRTVFEELAPAALAFVAELLDSVPEAERAVLDRTLTKLIERSKQLSIGVATAPATR